MKKYLFTYLILTSSLNAADTYNPSTSDLTLVTIATKKLTSLWSIPLEDPTNDRTCNFDYIKNHLLYLKSSKKQQAYISQLLREKKCPISRAGDTLEFGKTVTIPNNLNVIIRNEHGAIACEANKDFAIRTGGKSKILNKLTSGRVSGGSKIWCDYNPKSATIADKSQLEKEEKNLLREKEYT